jgi:branched-chain amino acid aminotransferase
MATPAITAGIQDSDTRDTLIQLARQELRMEVVERGVDRTELYLADEGFLCGTGADVRPLLSVDRFTLGDGRTGSRTRQIAALHHDVVRGTHGQFGQGKRWCENSSE